MLKQLVHTATIRLQEVNIITLWAYIRKFLKSSLTSDFATNIFEAAVVSLTRDRSYYPTRT
jgi:hypothetical protein